jgi:hypothetical protein
MIKAYCLKTKEKNVPMQDAVVSKTAKAGIWLQVMMEKEIKWQPFLVKQSFTSYC